MSALVFVVLVVLALLGLWFGNFWLGVVQAGAALLFLGGWWLRALAARRRR